MNPSNALKLFALLESDKREDISKASEFVQENLYESKEAALLNALVDYHIETRSQNALKILSEIPQGQAMNLFEKLNECMKQSEHRYGAVNILGAVVRQQPSWLYKIVSTQLFASVIRDLKTESNVVFLMSGVLIITTLLPMIPSLVGRFLIDFFEIFMRLAAISNQRSVNVANVYILHLQVALYAFFHRLYAMYPNNFINFLQQCCSQERYRQVFTDIIEPMMEHVRLNPQLIVHNSQSETSTARWRKKEPHDIVVECQHMSLDPLDAIQEPYIAQEPQSPQSSNWPAHAMLERSISWTTQSGECDSQSQYSTAERKDLRRLSDSATQTGKSLQDLGKYFQSTCSEPDKDETYDDHQTLWSPTRMCGLTTPPKSQDISPATSHWDVSLSAISQTSLSRCSTPTPYATPVESPSPMLGRSSKKTSPYKTKDGDATVLQQALHTALEKTLSTKNKTLDDRTSSGSQSKSNSLEGRKLYFDEVNKFKPISAASLAIPAQGHRVGLSAVDTDSDLETDSKSLPGLSHQNSRESGSDFPHGSLEESYDSNTATDKESGISDDKVLTNSSSEEASAATSPEGDTHPLSPEGGKGEGEQDQGSSADGTTQTNLECRSEGSVVSCMHDKSRSDSGISCQQIESVNAEVLPPSLEKAAPQEQTLPCPSECPASTTKPLEDKDDIGPCVHLMSLALPYPSSMCKLCMEIPNSDARSTSGSFVFDPKPSQGLHVPSPLQLLDLYIEKGTGLHHKQLSRIPLTSHPSINWTHYGGTPPPDEITILRDQINLLHQQLLFERHKCQLHAMRNRRLVVKTLKANALEQANKALKEQLELKDKELSQVSMTLNAKCEENRILKEGTKSWDENLQNQLRICREDSKSLKSINDELSKKTEEQTAIIDDMKMKLQECNSKIFQLENKLEFQKQELTKNELLKSELERVTGELIVMGELHQQHKDVMKQAKLKDTQVQECNSYIQSQEKELKACKDTVHKQTAELDMRKGKIAELETALSSKDHQLLELKRYLEVLKGTYLGQLESLEEKYQALKRINQRLESHIFSLYAIIDSNKQKNKSNSPSKAINRSLSVDSHQAFTGK